jgi:hypothetical protein
LSKEALEKDFPNLADDGYEIISPIANRYNCIAWASKDSTRKWDCPDFYWPPGASTGDGIDALISVFAVQGYEICADGSPEEGFEKVVLYSDSSGEWQHAARQLPDGKWTSKMGRGEDIAHTTPNGVADSIYGQPQYFMKRTRSAKNVEED